MAAGSARDTGSLQRHAAALRAEADALVEAYRRRTWWRFVLVFFPIPFVERCDQAAKAAEQAEQTLQISGASRGRAAG